MILAVMVISGCGSEGDFEMQEKKTTLEANPEKELQVNPGDSLIPAGEDTKIRVSHDYSTDTKHVTILSGSAELIRGDYVQEGG